MSMVRRRKLAAFSAALISGTFACSERPRDAIDAVADTMTTPTMRRDLTSDLRAAEQALQQIQDSVDVALGADIAIQLRPMREDFVAFTKEQCARLKGVFKDGTYGAVAELECLIHMMDSRREFIEDHYDFIERIRAARRANANAAHLRRRAAGVLH